MFKEVDHIAIVVRDTQNALSFYRDQMGLPLLYSETLDEVGVRLTHLDMGNVRLQLVQPLNAEHPLTKHLEEHGEGFHHVCWKVDNVEEAMQELDRYKLGPKPNEPHPAPRGGSAAFIEPGQTRGVLWEMTASKP
ncbi:MAG: VOC family protein [Verrucomicrobiales bacterium]